MRGEDSAPRGGALRRNVGRAGASSAGEGGGEGAATNVGRALPRAGGGERRGSARGGRGGVLGQFARHQQARSMDALKTVSKPTLRSTFPPPPLWPWTPDSLSRTLPPVWRRGLNTRVSPPESGLAVRCDDSQDLKELWSGGSRRRPARFTDLLSTDTHPARQLRYMPSASADSQIHQCHVPGMECRAYQI